MISKRINFFVILIVCVACSLHSQDTIKFLSKEIKVVRVNEVATNEISYSKFDNLNGPIYRINKDDIFYIKYSNGSVDSIHSQFFTNTPSGSYKAPADSIIIKGNSLYFQGQPLGENRLGKLVKTVTNEKKKYLLILEYEKLKKYRKQQYLNGFVGLGLGVNAFFLGIVGTTITEDATPLLVGFVSGAVISITGAVISSVKKIKRNKQKVKVARLYNQSL